MSIRLKDTIYDLIDKSNSSTNSDKLDNIDSSLFLYQGDSNSYDNTSGHHVFYMAGSNTPLGSNTYYGSVLQWGSNPARKPDNTSTDNWYTQLWSTTGSRLYYRTRTNGADWTSLKTIAWTSDIPSSLKCPNSLKIQGNGTDLGTYDGSAAKTINITYSNVGAAASSHNHDSSYALKSHSHDYLPLSGGTLTDNLTLEGNGAYRLIKVGDSDGTYVSVHNSMYAGTDGKREASISLHEGSNLQGAIGVKTYPFFVDSSSKVHTILHSNNWSSYCAPASHTHDYASSSHNHNSSYVTALSTSGNYLTWTKNGSTNNITVPYSVKSAQDSDGNAINTTYLKKSKFGYDCDTYTFNVAQTATGWIYLGYFYGSNSGVKIECDYASHCGNDYGIYASHLIVGVRPYTLQGFISKVKGSSGGLYISEETISGDSYKNYHIYIYLGAWYQGQVRITKLGSNDFNWSKTSASPNSSHTCVLDTRTLDGYYVCHKGAVTKVSNSYNDLTNKPTIPSVGNGTVTIKQAGTSKGSFTLNQSGNATIELTDNNTWRGITDSYSGTATDTSLSQKGGNALYNALVNGYASSAGNADTVDNKHASDFAAASHTHSYITPYGEGSTASTRTADYTTALCTGGWASNSSGYGSTYGTTLDVSGYSTWYHRLAFRTDGKIEYWQGINTKAMTKIGTISFSDTNTWRPITNTYTGSDQSTSVSQYGTNALYNALVNGYASSAGNADTCDSHHFSTVSSLPSSPNSSTVYFIV